MKKRGFSLLEILVTVGILALLAVASIPSLSKLEDQKSKENTVNLISSCIAEAKAKAQAPSSHEIDEYQAVVSNRSCNVEAVTNGATENYNEYTIDNGYTLKEIVKGKPVVVIKFSTDNPYLVSGEARNSDGSGSVALSNSAFIYIVQDSSGLSDIVTINFSTGIITN